jgi:hypothetical protein
VKHLSHILQLFEPCFSAPVFPHPAHLNAFPGLFTAISFLLGSVVSEKFSDRILIAIPVHEKQKIF